MKKQYFYPTTSKELEYLIAKLQKKYTLIEGIGYISIYKKDTLIGKIKDVSYFDRILNKSCNR